MEMSVGNTWLFSIFRYDCFLSALTWSSKKESNFSTSSICFLCALLHFSSCSTRETWCLSKWWLWLSAGSIREKILFSWSFTSIVNSKNWWIHFELSFIISPKTAPIVLIRERYIPSQQLRCSSHHCSNCSTFEVSSTDEWVLFDFTFFSCLLSSWTPDLALIKLFWRKNDVCSVSMATPNPWTETGTSLKKNISLSGNLRVYLSNVVKSRYWKAFRYRLNTEFTMSSKFGSRMFT